jgi:septal ring factor EnvC (AmiA/AmiB activator)
MRCGARPLCWFLTRNLCAVHSDSRPSSCLLKELFTAIMKAVFLAAALLGGGVFYAQGQGFAERADTTITPAQQAQNETNRLTRFFNLSSSQQSAVLELLAAADTQIAAIRTQIQPLHATLIAAIKANTPQEINAALQQISALQVQIESMRAMAAGQIYATVLTATQQAQIPNGLGPLMGGMMDGGFRGRR